MLPPGPQVHNHCFILNIDCFTAEEVAPVKVKREDEMKRSDPDGEREDLESRQTEQDGHAHHGHKRRYDESHGYSYYEHREDRR